MSGESISLRGATPSRGWKQTTSTAVPSIGFIAAAAQVHEYRAKSRPAEARHRRQGIMGMQIAFKTMEDEHGRAGTRGPGEINEITIGQFNPLPLERQLRPRAEKFRPQGLQMWIAQPEGR